MTDNFFGKKNGDNMGVTSVFMLIQDGGYMIAAVFGILSNVHIL